MKKIIFVGCEEVLLAGEEGLLRRKDLKVISAPSNADALAMHRSERADLIVALLESPELGGEEFCSLVREEKGLREVAIILLCPEGGTGRCRESKANDCFTLPVDQEEILARIPELLHVTKREDFRILVSARVEGRYQGKTFFCNLVNISQTGMLLSSTRDLDRGDRISCSFFLPGTERITVRGDIVRIGTVEADGRQYGVRFASLADAERDSIETFIRGR